MKTKFYLFLALAVGAGSLTGFTLEKKNQVRHVVVFKYKPSATPVQINEVTEAFRSLQNKIPGIVSFEHGPNMSPEKLDKGFHHVYLLTFENTGARDTYLPHPDHKKFGELLGKLGVIEEVFVVDFQSEE